MAWNVFRLKCHVSLSGRVSCVANAARAISVGRLVLLWSCDARACLVSERTGPVVENSCESKEANTVYNRTQWGKVNFGQSVETTTLGDLRCHEGRSKSYDVETRFGDVIIVVIDFVISDDVECAAAKGERRWGTVNWVNVRTPRRRQILAFCRISPS